MEQKNDLAYKSAHKLFIVAGPSGVGKGSIISQVLAKHSDMNFSVSSTTRKPRSGEVEGKNYYFKTKEEFLRLINSGKMLEWAEFAGNLYGTSIDVLEGGDTILEIEIQGARQIREKIKDAVFIFILPPDFEELKNRLIGRGTETEAEIEKRLDAVKKELAESDIFDYKIVNDNLETAIKEFEKIILKERSR